MKTFVSVAGKKVTDVRSFIREAGTGNSIKYSAVKGGKHIVYVPYIVVPQLLENGETVNVKQIVSISAEVHEWTSPDGRYRGTICTKGLVVPDENDPNKFLYDGECKFCNRIVDAWDIYKYRKELAEKQCTLVGEERKKAMETAVSTLASERKVREAVTYMYMLVVLFRTDPAKNNDVILTDGLPEYDLKVMKWSSSRSKKIQQTIENGGAELPGIELVFEYPNTDDKRVQISQSTVTPLITNKMITTMYPGVLNKINQDVAKFTWEGIEKAFPEWTAMTLQEAEKITDALFEKWDQYKRELAINPSAKYLEYVTNIPTNNPSLNPAQAVAGAGGITPGFIQPGFTGAPFGAGAIPGQIGVQPGANSGTPMGGQPAGVPVGQPFGATQPFVPGGVPVVAQGATGANGTQPQAGSIPPVPDINSVFGGANGNSGIKI